MDICLYGTSMEENIEASNNTYRRVTEIYLRYSRHSVKCAL